jgi:hypothetical protein
LISTILCWQKRIRTARHLGRARKANGEAKQSVGQTDVVTPISRTPYCIFLVCWSVFDGRQVAGHRAGARRIAAGRHLHGQRLMRRLVRRPPESFYTPIDKISCVNVERLNSQTEENSNPNVEHYSGSDTLERPSATECWAAHARSVARVALPHRAACGCAHAVQNGEC